MEVDTPVGTCKMSTNSIMKSKTTYYTSYCIAPGCTNRNRRGKINKQYHRLPRYNPFLLERWLFNLKLAPGAEGKTGCAVCSDHFTVNDYQQKGSFDSSGTFTFLATRRLKDDAVPTKFDISNEDTSAAPVGKMSKQLNSPSGKTLSRGKTGKVHNGSESAKLNSDQVPENAMTNAKKNKRGRKILAEAIHDIDVPDKRPIPRTVNQSTQTEEDVYSAEEVGRYVGEIARLKVEIRHIDELAQKRLEQMLVNGENISTDINEALLLRAVRALGESTNKLALSTLRTALPRRSVDKKPPVEEVSCPPQQPTLGVRMSLAAQSAETHPEWTPLQSHSEQTPYPVHSERTPSPDIRDHMYSRNGNVVTVSHKRPASSVDGRDVNTQGVPAPSVAGQDSVDSKPSQSLLVKNHAAQAPDTASASVTQQRLKSKSLQKPSGFMVPQDFSLLRDTTTPVVVVQDTSATFQIYSPLINEKHSPIGWISSPMLL